MNILAVDTSSKDLLVSVETSSYFEESCTESADFKHSERLMDVIIGLLDRAKIKIKDIDLFVCTRGPGSFTGLRIGMSALKGMAYGNAKPLVSVSTLNMWANTVKNFDGVVVPALDAKKQRYYLSAFECKEGKVTRLLDDTDGNAEDLKNVFAYCKNILVVGPDREAFKQILDSVYPDKIITCATNFDVSALRSLIELAKKQFLQSGADHIGQGPVYLRKSDAEIALEEKQKSEENNV